MEEQIERLENLINEQGKIVKEQEKMIKELEYKLEKHKHSGKETADISNILQERLGIKMGTFTGGTGLTGINFDFANILVSVGNQSAGQTIINSLDEKYFGIEWNTVGGQYFTTNVPFSLPYASSDPTGTNGLIYYNTTSHKIKVYENGTWRTITTT